MVGGGGGGRGRGRGRGFNASNAGKVERWLALLALPADEEQGEQVQFVLRWWVSCSICWATCCVLAGL